MRDVARSASVSQSTVSRALANNPRISEPTRKRVQEAVRRLGYRRDAGSSHLVARRWGRHSAGANVAVFYEYQIWWDWRADEARRFFFPNGG